MPKPHKKKKKKHNPTKKKKKKPRTPKANPRQKAKVERVLHEFKAGTLKSSSGQLVTSRDQAIAIALSEAGLSRPESQNPGKPTKRKKKRKKKGGK
jgi:cytochrome c553